MAVRNRKKICLYLNDAILSDIELNAMGILATVQIETSRKPESMNIHTKIIIILIALCVSDVVIPVPILGLTLIYVVLQRPPWFMETVQKIYHTE